MPQIDLKSTEHSKHYAMEVTVCEGQSCTHHHVTLQKSDYKRLAEGSTSPEGLVEASFRFLLEREPKESILRSFDLTVISRYFSEYEQEIRRRI